MKTFDFSDTGGLFDHFEVNHQPFWPRISRLLGGSIIFHCIVVACVVFIPPVRNALSIALVLSGGKFVDRAYTKTSITDDMDIVELTGEKFHYPEGYFLMDQQAMPSPSPLFPPISFVPKPATPLANASPSPEVSPSPKTTEVATNAKPSPTVSPSPDAKARQDEKTRQELEKAAKDNGVTLPQDGEINTRPFKDLGALAVNLKRENKLNIDLPVEIVIEGKLDEHGKLADAKVTRKAGDPVLLDLSEKLVAAMNDSGVLSLLNDLNKNNPGTKVTFTIKQDNYNVTAAVESEAKDDDSARVLVKGFNAALAFGAWKRAGKTEEPLLKSTTAIQDGKKVIFNFSMPRQGVADVIKKGMASVTPTPSG